MTAEQAGKERGDKGEQDKIPDDLPPGIRIADGAANLVENSHGANGYAIPGAVATSNSGRTVNRAARADGGFTSPAAHTSDFLLVPVAVPRIVLARRFGRFHGFNSRQLGAALPAELLVDGVRRSALHTKHGFTSRSQTRSVRSERLDNLQRLF
jgi:hypothetical protein